MARRMVLSSSRSATGIMKILVIGGGGREHAMVWKLAQSPSVEKVWCAPGNGGIAADAECVPLDLKDVKRGGQPGRRNSGADLTIVGPELPLVLGIADEFERRGLKLLGPAEKAAQLEGSKVFSKQFMQRHDIPTAESTGYTSRRWKRTLRLIRPWPLVIKADGLCAGKGVLVTSSADEATEFVDRAMVKREFGEAGSRII